MMERAGRIIGKLKFPKDLVDPGDMARSAWPAAVGKKIAVKTRAVKLVRNTLVIECADAVWQRQLNTLSGQILRNLENLLGAGVVTELDLRPMTPRRGMQSAATVRPFELGVKPEPISTDEADQIQDPVFRLLYKQSRRRAVASSSSQESLAFEEQQRKASA
ncbi:hypothetical protein F183_A32650 [Bryobacterales bacterium F-183]|nr:hypothetical protein F183_A32650 [Bryobacterales bacterium F-183]